MESLTTPETDLTPQWDLPGIDLDGLAVNDVDPIHIDWWCRFHLQGEKQRDIAASADISATTVCRMIQRVQKIVLRNTVGMAQDVKARALVRLDWLIAEASREWLKSCQRVETTQKTVNDGNQVDRTEITTRNMLGDIRYLDTIRGMLAEQCKITGAYAPRRTEHRGDPLSVSLTQSVTIQDVDGLPPAQLAAVRDALATLQHATRPAPDHAPATARDDDPMDGSGARIGAVGDGDG